MSYNKRECSELVIDKKITRNAIADIRGVSSELVSGSLREFVAREK